MNTDHLNALEVNLSNERVRLYNAKTCAERDLRSVWVSQLEREVAKEKEFIGYVEPAGISGMSEDELMAELMA